MVKLNVDYDSKAKCWFVKTSDLLGVHAEGETLEQLCGKLPAIVSDLVESNQTKMAGTCYCSFCGKSQHEVPNLIAKTRRPRSGHQNSRDQAGRTQTAARRCREAA